MRVTTRMMAALAVTGALAAAGGGPAGASTASEPSAGRLIASGLSGTIGGTIGPDGALYVTEGGPGRITRVDPRTGQTSTFADGLPPQVIPLGGAMDVAFVGRTAYVLVTLVSADVGGNSISGIYRIDGRHRATVIADIGAWSIANPPPPHIPIDVPSGLQYALEPVHGGFLVSDGHHNRILRVTFSGEISEELTMENVVPTGMAVSGRTVYVAETGPVPHTPETGKIVAFRLRRDAVETVASGYSLMVDVARARGHQLYALSQGDSPGDVPPASPALPDSGELLRIHRDGSITVVVERLDLPTSVHFTRHAALIVTLNGEVWRIDDVHDLCV